MAAKWDKKPFVLLNDNKTLFFFLLIYCFLRSEKGLVEVNISKTVGGGSFPVKVHFLCKTGNTAN